MDAPNCFYKNVSAPYIYTHDMMRLDLAFVMAPGREGKRGEGRGLGGNQCRLHDCRGIRTLVLSKFAR